MMKIAYVVNQYPKDSHAFILREIRALEELGIEIDRYALRGWNAEFTDEEMMQEQRRTQYVLQQAASELPRSLLWQLRMNPRGLFAAQRRLAAMFPQSDRSTLLHAVTFMEACWLAERVVRRGAQHIHAHFGTNSAELALYASAMTGLSYSFTVHGPDEFDGPKSSKLGLKAHHADFVVAISQFCASQIFRWIPLPEYAKVKIVRCGVSPKAFKLDASVPESNINLLSVGRLNRQKGQNFLLEAVRLLRDEGLDVSLTIVGDGELKSEMLDLRERLQLGDAVQFLGSLPNDEIRMMMRRSQYFVLSSLAEGLPVVLMEAMAEGAIAIATQVAATGELVVDGETGYLAPAGSALALAGALKRAFAAPAEDRKAMAERAAARVARDHDVERSAMLLLTEFRRCVEAHQVALAGSV